MAKPDRALNQEIRAKRQAARARMRDLRRAIVKLTGARRRLLRAAASECKRIKAAARHEASGVYGRKARARADLSCATDRVKALQQYGRRLGELVDEFALQDAVLSRTAKPPTKAQRAAGMRRAEAWDRERQNIPPEFLPLWDKYGRQKRFAPLPHAPRWERFLEWAQSDEGIDETYQLAEQDAEKYIQRLAREYQRQAVAEAVPF